MKEASMAYDRLVSQLKDILILQKLTLKELQRFALICDLREYASGERIVEQDSLGLDLDILLGGSVDVTLRGKEGTEMTLSTIRQGDVLGEAAIFMDLPRTASAVAHGDCLVAAIPRDRLFTFCDKNPKAGLKIFTFVIYGLLKRLGATNRSLVDERESVVTSEDLERLYSHFPKSLEDMLES